MHSSSQQWGDQLQLVLLGLCSMSWREGGGEEGGYLDAGHTPA
jgi:hypothetical protein